jgi:hypothetical protein
VVVVIVVVVVVVAIVSVKPQQRDIRNITILHKKGYMFRLYLTESSSGPQGSDPVANI